MANNTQFIIQWVVQGAQNVVNSTKQISSSLDSMSAPIASSKDKMNNLGTALAGLTSRALLTIPVWLALREAFMGGIRAFDESVKSIVEIDTALKNLEMQLGNTRNAAQTLAQVKVNAQNLALQTGESPQSLIDVYTQMFSVFKDGKFALEGMNIAARGALVTNSESKDVISTLLLTYNQLGQSITAVQTPAEKLNFIMNTMSVLMTKNHVGIKDFDSALKTFGGQAAKSGLSLDQTLSVIAAESNVDQTGQFAGRGLTGIFRQISLQRANVEDFLGKSTSGQGDWKTFLDVLQKIQSIKPSDVQGNQLLDKVFSLRGGGQAMRALASEAHYLTDNLKDLGSVDLTPVERQAVFDGRLNTSLEKIVNQADRVKQAADSLGRSFIDGATGGSHFSTTLKDIADQMDKLNGSAKTLGATLSAMALVGGAAAVGGAAGVGLRAAGARALAGSAAKAIPSSALVEAGETASAGLIGASFATPGAGATLATVAALATKVLGPLAIIYQAGMTAKKMLDIEGGTSDNFAAAADLDKQTEAQSIQFKLRSGAKLVRTGGLAVATPTPTDVGTADTTSADDLVVQGQILDLKKQEKEVEKDLESYGYTKIQILSQELTALQNQVGTINNLKAAEEKRLELAQAYADEVNKSAQSYMGSAEKGLTDLFMGNVKVPKGSHTGVLGAALAPFGTDIRQQQAGALSGNIVEQIFGKTGLANAFGKSTTALRGNDPTYQGTFDGARAGVIAGFGDVGIGKGGGANVVSAQGGNVSLTGGVPSALQFITASRIATGSLGAQISAFGGGTSPYSISSLFGGTTDTATGFSVRANQMNLPGWSLTNTSDPAAAMYNHALAVGGSGNYGLGASAAGVAKTGSSPLTSVNSFIEKYMGISPSGQFQGTLPGFGEGGIFTKALFGGSALGAFGGGTSPMSYSGASAANTAGLSFSKMPTSSMGGWGTAAQGIGALVQGFGTYNSLGGKNGSMALPSSILGTAGSIADMIPGGQVIGGALSLISGVLGLFNTTKKVTDQVSTHQVASKLDETNQQLAMVNRNLVGMKSSIDTYIMPNSAYFSQKGNLSDQFALDQQRA